MACMANGCDRKDVARGMCLMHYKRWQQWGDPNICRPPIPIMQRLMKRVTKDGQNGCWVWEGAVEPKGYGKINRGDQTTMSVHRVSWEQHRGPIPDGLWVLHRCDNPPCVNPDHLFLGTALDNVQDMDMKGRRRSRYVYSETRVLALPRGEDHHQSKLSADEVRAIRVALGAGETGRSLAEKYAITPATISGIRLRKIWRHI